MKGGIDTRLVTWNKLTGPYSPMTARVEAEDSHVVMPCRDHKLPSAVHTSHSLPNDLRSGNIVIPLELGNNDCPNILKADPIFLNLH